MALGRGGSACACEWVRVSAVNEAMKTDVHCGKQTSRGRALHLRSNACIYSHKRNSFNTNISARKALFTLGVYVDIPHGCGA